MATESKAPSKACMNRLMTDLKEMRDNPPEGCSAAPVSEDNLLIWNARYVVCFPPKTKLTPRAQHYWAR